MDRSPHVVTGILAVLGIALAGSAAAEAPAPVPLERIAYRAAPPARILLSFKLDPRLTRGLYMGDRWLSPATFRSTTHAAGKSIAVETRAVIVDARGRRTRLRPAWTVAEPRILSVTPADGNEVVITARRPGTGHVTVSYGPISRTLTVTAIEDRGTWRVEISQ